MDHIENGSFEAVTLCPTAYGQITRAYPWIRVGGDATIGLSNSCAAPTCECAVPQGFFGYQYPHSGNGYVVMNNIPPNGWLPFHAEPNFLGQPLAAPLIEGRTYKLRFFINLTDSSCVASKNIGAYFSVSQPPEDIGYLLSLEPQIRYEGDYLANKWDWMEIQGEFIAQGGEDFITIGNFDGYFNSDTTYVGNCGVSPNTTTALYYWYLAYYNIDDISLIEVDTTVGIGDAERPRGPRVDVYPNPTDAALNIDILDVGRGLWAFRVVTPVGQVLRQGSLSHGQNRLSTKELLSGVYIVQIFNGDEMVEYSKIIVQH